MSVNPPLYIQKNTHKKKEPFSKFDEYKNHNIKKHEEFDLEKKEHKDN